jgi:malate dehydrogenase (oxaloacetate-decarboxylating)(NADP+)
MIYETSKALADSLTEEEINQGWLYPSLERIRQVSATIAVAVCKQALEENSATTEAILKFKDNEIGLLKYVESHMWTPDTIHHHDNKL